MSDPRQLLRSDLPTSRFAVAEIAHRAKLDQNESPVALPAPVRQLVLDDLAALPWNRYPQPARYAEIKRRFAAAVGQPAERIVLTAGCDQLILLAFWAAGGVGRRALFFEPTYPMYSHYARITQTGCERRTLDADFVIAPELIDDCDCELVALVSPNNPTGSVVARPLVLRALKGPRLVFVDEAYADFAAHSVLDLVAEQPNLLVGRSLSKALLAGVRLGYGVGAPELIEVLERLLFAPYHLSALQLAVAYRFAEIRPHLAAAIGQVVAERDRVAAALGALGVEVWPSESNFLLFSPGDAGATAACQAELLRQGVRLRDVSGMPGLGHHLRVTVGTSEENEIFLRALEHALHS